MVKRGVFLEKSEEELGGPYGLLHYAVKVDEEWYESEPVENTGRINGKRNTINGSLNGKPRSDSERQKRKNADLICAGATYKTSDEILAFNWEWIERNPKYGAMSYNCQKYAQDFIQFLVGGSYKMEMPLFSASAYALGPGSHALSQDGYSQARGTTGRVGAQFGYFGTEVEGPSGGVGVGIDDPYVGVEASLARVEGQVGPAVVRLEPNLNTAIGVQGGQLKVKVAGFGFTIRRGLGIHTPLGSFGFGNI